MTAIPEEFKLIDRYWKASNYLAVGQIYLLDKNPLLQKPLELSDVKKRLLGHFGTTPGQNFIYVHCNRLISERKLSMIYLSGPGHGGPAIVAQVYLEGTYEEYYPAISNDLDGMGKLFKQFSFPGGIPSHVAPETPGSIHEGGELGYSLAHSFGAVLDKPDLIVTCVVGDGEAETGPLATSWHSNKFLNPRTDGAVLPILHLNGFKIANPVILDRIPREELMSLFSGYGYDVLMVEGDDPALVHPAMAKAMDEAMDKIQAIQKKFRDVSPEEVKKLERPKWPLIIFKTPKGWTGPKQVDGLKIEGNWRSHQVPVSDTSTNKEHMKVLEEWLLSYNPHENFDEFGCLKPELQALIPPKGLRMGENPYTNPTVKPLILPDWRKFGVNVTEDKRGQLEASDTYQTGIFLRDVIKLNDKQRNFRLFGPDETASNRLHAVFEATSKQWMGEYREGDEAFLAPNGRVMEMLSEHMCEGWLEGYLLTGGHGLLNSYEAFIHIISSMFNQHAKWYKLCNEIEWRRKLSSLNILLASHVWRQDHNGFTHQDPGFLQHVSMKKPEIVRIYLPPDANCLLSCMDHCLASKHYVNVLVAGKHPAPQWLTIEEADHHCAAGIGIWEWASNDKGTEPDLIMACAGDVPTLEALAATSILRQEMPSLRIRFVNIVDVMRLSEPGDHPHGMSHNKYDSIFGSETPVLFNYHAYPQGIERIIFGRNNTNFKVKGYMEEGTISTAFDMCVMNGVDRYHLVMDVCDIVMNKCPSADRASKAAAPYVRQSMESLLSKHKSFIHEHGVDMPEIAEWKWQNPL